MTMTNREMLAGTDPVLFGRIVRKIRLMQALSERELARKIHKTVDWVGAVENGKEKISITTTKKLAKAFDIPFPVLVFLAKDYSRIEGKSLRQFIESIAKLFETIIKAK